MEANGDWDGHSWTKQQAATGVGQRGQPAWQGDLLSTGVLGKIRKYTEDGESRFLSVIGRSYKYGK